MAKVVQMAKRGMLGICDILLFVEANISSERRIDSGEGGGGGGSIALSICWHRGQGMDRMVVGGVGSGETGMACPSTSQRIPAVVRKVKKRKKPHKSIAMYAS